MITSSSRWIWRPTVRRHCGPGERSPVEALNRVLGAAVSSAEVRGTHQATGPTRADPDGLRGSLAMTGDDGGYAAVIRQAAHDAVRALLATSPDSIAGSQALREVTTWLAAEHGAAAVIDLAEELAADLAEAFDAVAAAEGRPALAVLDSWFHDIPPPLTAPGLTSAAEPGEAPRGREDREEPPRGGATS
jgi:hypothetical protein